MKKILFLPSGIVEHLAIVRKCALEDGVDIDLEDPNQMLAMTGIVIQGIEAELPKYQAALGEAARLDDKPSHARYQNAIESAEHLIALLKAHQAELQAKFS